MTGSHSDPAVQRAIARLRVINGASCTRCGAVRGTSCTRRNGSERLQQHAARVKAAQPDYSRFGPYAAAFVEDAGHEVEGPGSVPR